MKIGILGKTGSGKSTVASFFKKEGYDVIDIDQLAKELPLKYPMILDEISKVFGLDYVASGDIDRKKLGALVFSSEKELRKLNSIFFKYIQKEVEKITSEKDNIIVEGVIIFEAELDKYLDKTIFVYCDDINKSLSRLQKRENTPMEVLEKRLFIQRKYDKDKIKADYQIENTGSQKLLLNKLNEIRKIWISEN